MKPSGPTTVFNIGSISDDSATSLLVLIIGWVRLGYWTTLTWDSYCSILNLLTFNLPHFYIASDTKFYAVSGRKILASLCSIIPFLRRLTEVCRRSHSERHFIRISNGANPPSKSRKSTVWRHTFRFQRREKRSDGGTVASAMAVLAKIENWHWSAINQRFRACVRVRRVMRQLVAVHSAAATGRLRYALSPTTRRSGVASTTVKRALSPHCV